ncbi:MAG: membrane protein insertase YidC [Bacteroidales bacterium]|nr:membrane protein insertase YidC [Bacteroidales bacterium]HOY38943.1 membrane protein insertase YidC [Bacteroidales bacterium]
MDRNTILGLLVIGLIIVGYYFISKPSKAELEKQLQYRDSIQQALRADSLEKAKTLELKTDTVETDTVVVVADTIISDSAKAAVISQKYGVFAPAAQGENKMFTVENQKMIISFSPKGGRVYSVQLKDFLTHDSLPVVLFSGDTTLFGLELMAGGTAVFTNDLYFTPVNAADHIDAKSKDQKIAMRLYADTDKYVEYNYIVHPDSYMIDFNIVFHNMQNVLSENVSYSKLQWSLMAPAQEKGRKWELQNTAVYVKMDDNEIEHLSLTKETDEFSSGGKVHWIAFKQQFFSSVLIAKELADDPIVKQKTFTGANSKYLKQFAASFTFPVKRDSVQIVPMQFYFGPNKFSILKKFDIKLEKLVPLGWGIFGWFNRFLIIPIFTWLGSFIGSYGLIIFLLTIIIKLLLFPLTYKSYMSTAKMKVLKPQIDELTKKFPKGKEMERQQATMSLYKRAGVSPMGGCIPLLLQFPILIALFNFFPASIELRQQSFLWAHDLSTYDSIVTFPFNIPWYGDHVSLFTLLMAISLLVSTMMTNATQSGTQQMPGMKIMLYLMPVMMLFWFNDYAAGLSYYYLLANLITILQTWVIRRFFVDEEKVLAKLEENKKKPVKKSKWQERLEMAAKQQGRR